MQKKKKQIQPEIEYPYNLIEGKILKINHSAPRSLVLDADTSKISTAKSPSMEKIIKLTPETKLVLYDMSTKKESSLIFSRFRKGDCIVISTKEPTYEKIDQISKFTAIKISKFINYQKSK